MKIFAFFLSAVLAIDSTLLMLMMQQNSVANPNQGGQMGLMLPLLLLDDKDAKSADNKNLLIMMMMQGAEMGDTQAILPLLLLDDGELDFKSFFLYSNMLKQGNFIFKNDTEKFYKKSNLVSSNLSFFCNFPSHEKKSQSHGKKIKWEFSKNLVKNPMGLKNPGISRKF